MGMLNALANAVAVHDNGLLSKRRLACARSRTMTFKFGAKPEVRINEALLVSLLAESTHTASIFERMCMVNSAAWRSASLHNFLCGKENLSMIFWVAPVMSKASEPRSRFNPINTWFWFSLRSQSNARMTKSPCDESRNNVMVSAARANARWRRSSASKIQSSILSILFREPIPEMSCGAPASQTLTKCSGAGAPKTGIPVGPMAVGSTIFRIACL